jgi:hypothetical protein
VLTPKPVGYYFRIMGEVNVFRVNDAGLTNFLPHTTYALVGGNAEVRAVLFERPERRACTVRNDLLHRQRKIWRT